MCIPNVNLIGLSSSSVKLARADRNLNGYHSLLGKADFADLLEVAQVSLQIPSPQYII
jgi:hypothetical protein